MHTANQPYNVLDGASKQKNPRSSEDLARLNRYAPVLRSYCAAGDPVCAGGEIVADHLNYFELYTDEASSWVVSKINGVAPLPSCASSSSSSSSSVPTPTASVSASSVVPTPTASVSASSVVPTPTASVSASSVVVPAGSSSGGEPYIPTPSKDAETPYPTSPATISPFPPPVDYDACVLQVHVEYVYAHM